MHAFLVALLNVNGLANTGHETAASGVNPKY